MKHSVIYKLMATAFFLCSGFIAYAQQTVQLDALQKIMSIVAILFGAFIGYMQMKLGQKLAEQENKYNSKLDTVKAEFSSAIEKLKTEFNYRLEHTENKLELKIDNRLKDVENRMATHHDINGLKQIMLLQHENTKESQEAIKDQLKIAASIYKRDNKHE